MPKKEMRRSDCLRPQHPADWCSCRSLAGFWRGKIAACREIRTRFAHIGRNRKCARVHGAMNRPNRHPESLFRLSGKLADSSRCDGGGKVRSFQWGSGRMPRRNQRFSPRSPSSDGPFKAASRLDQIIQDEIRPEDSPRPSANAVAPAASRHDERPFNFLRNSSRPSGSVRGSRRIKAPRTRKERGRRAPSPQAACGRPVRAGR